MSGDPTVVNPADGQPFLALPPREFCLRSLTRRYGLFFLGRVIVRHPCRTIKGLLSYRSLSSWSMEGEDITRLFLGPAELLTARLAQEKARLLVAVGFCQKPLVPPCRAGRANHDCWYFDGMDLRREPGELDPACAACLVREIGLQALAAGASMHVMTSALDIAKDVMLPSIERKRFNTVIMSLCPYSVQAIALPLTICGLRGYLLSYASGSCANWEQWLQADRGIKDELTRLGPVAQAKLTSLLKGVAEARRAEGAGYYRFERSGNIYVPISSETQRLRAGADLP